MLKFRHVAIIGAIAWGYGYGIAAFAQSAPIPFDKITNQAIHRIDVLEVGEPSAIVLHGTASQNTAPSKSSLQVAYAKSEIDANAEASSKLKAGFARRSMALSSEFARPLVEALKAKGYDARAVAGQRLKRKIDDGFDYSGLNTDADAVLDVQVRSAGYLPHQGGTALLPAMSVEAVLVSLKERKPVYRQSLMSGASLGPVGPVDVVQVAEGRKFLSRSAVLSNVDDAVDGLRDIATAIALRIADQLDK